jgi:hypothetical protein
MTLSSSIEILLSQHNFGVTDLVQSLSILVTQLELQSNLSQQQPMLGVLSNTEDLPNLQVLYQPLIDMSPASKALIK